MPILPVPSLSTALGGDSLVQGHLQSLLLTPGFLDAVPHLGQKVLQVVQELGFVLPELHPELPDLLSAGRGVFCGEHPPRTLQSQASCGIPGHLAHTIQDARSWG